MGRDVNGSIIYAVPTIISIHAPRMGRDGIKDFQKIIVLYFNPRAPYGARR